MRNRGGRGARLCMTLGSGIFALVTSASVLNDTMTSTSHTDEENQIPARASFTSTALPHFSGMFAAMSVTTTNWTEAQWDVDVQSMRDAGFTFFIVPHTLRQRTGPSERCPYGRFETFFPVEPSDFNDTGAACYDEIGAGPVHGAEGGTIGAVLRAAARAGLKVHVGLAFAPAEHGFPSQHRNGTYRSWGEYQATVARLLLSRFSDVTGIYTEIEFCNSDVWMSVMEDFGRDYLGTIARAVHALPGTSQVQVWASPYSIGNLTRHPTGYVSPANYAAGMRVAVMAAGSPTMFHHVAMQDSMGAQGNSFLNASEFLGNMSNEVKSWANVEIFEVWPADCQWPDPCHGRHPAPWNRIVKQMANEAAVLGGGSAATLIAWEWYSCFSPNAAGDPFHPDPAAAKANYESYLAYLRGKESPQDPITY